MQDVPTLTDMLAPGKQTRAKSKAVAAPTQLPTVSPSELPPSPSKEFLQFFWHVEQLRQKLYEKFDYKVGRRIENYTDGSACIKLICPAYGKGEPGSQPEQQTLSVGTDAEPWQMHVGLSHLRDAMAFFITRQEMTAVANDVITHLTPKQREALRWTLNELQL